MRNHLLHDKIGKHLHKKIVGKNIEILTDPACGGDQKIPLFFLAEKSRDTQLCQVDSLIMKNREVKVIIEIEESNIKPVQILGKLMASTIAKYYNNTKKEHVNIKMADNVIFIQVLDTKALPSESKKRKQWENINNSINEILPKLNTHIKTYKIFYGKLDDIKLDEITKFILGHL